MSKWTLIKSGDKHARQTAAPKMNWGGPKREGDVCPSCWSQYTEFVREDFRPEADRKAHPVPDSLRTILICACELDTDELGFYGFPAGLDVILNGDQPTTCPRCGARTDFCSTGEANNQAFNICLCCRHQFLTEDDED